MLQKIGRKLSNFAEKYIPEPFTLAVLLSFVTFSLVLFFTDTTAMETTQYWYKDFWSLLPFTTQMCMILVTGYALSTTPIAKVVIKRIAQYPKNTKEAVFIISFTSIFFGLINWGLAIVIGAFLTREIALQCQRRNIALHYPILGAAG